MTHVILSGCLIVYSFNKYLSSTPLALCAKHNPRCLGSTSNQIRWKSCPHGAYILIETTSPVFCQSGVGIGWLQKEVGGFGGLSAPYKDFQPVLLFSVPFSHPYLRKCSVAPILSLSRFWWNGPALCSHPPPFTDIQISTLLVLLSRLPCHLFIYFLFLVCFSLLSHFPFSCDLYLLVFHWILF